MNLRISDMMDEYEETEFKLQKRTDVSTARIKALTMEKIGAMPKRSKWRYGKLLGAVAAAIALLSCVAYAGATMQAKAQTAERGPGKTGTSVNYGEMELYIPGAGETYRGTMSRPDENGVPREEAICYTNVGAVFSVDFEGPYYAVLAAPGWLPGQAVQEWEWERDAFSSACSGGEGNDRYTVRVYSGAAFARGGLLLLQEVSAVEFGEIRGSSAIYVTSFASLHTGRVKSAGPSETVAVEHILFYDQNADCVVYLTGRDAQVLTRIAEELELTRTDQELTPQESGEMLYFAA